MDNTPPSATLGNVSTAVTGGSAVTFTVTYADTNSVDTTTFGNGNITVTLPGGSSVYAQLCQQEWERIVGYCHLQHGRPQRHLQHH